MEYSATCCILNSHVSIHCLTNNVIPLKLTPEFLLCLLSLCAIAGVSVFANMLVTNFSGCPQPAWHQHGGDGADCSDQVTSLI